MGKIYRPKLVLWRGSDFEKAVEESSNYLEIPFKVKMKENNIFRVKFNFEKELVTKVRKEKIALEVLFDKDYKLLVDF